ncbi:hypothetical protein [Streptomyces sp. NPDC090022]|uniref:hypothetical protein n=1 Tax=Streptomyces sp. NPDC090022 TaxID=3365920 RepID=UPI00382FD175
MSRTAHHIRSRRAPARGWFDLPAAEHRPGLPLHELTLRDLRHSARCRATAASAGHRPRPARVTRRVAIRSLARFTCDPSVARWAAEGEGRARRRVRDDLRRVLRTAHPRPGVPAAAAVAYADIAPYRHRRTALWQA